VGREEHGRHPCVRVVIDPRSSSSVCGVQKVAETPRRVKPVQSHREDSVVCRIETNGHPRVTPGFTSTFIRGFIPVAFQAPASETSLVLEPG